MKVTNMKGKSGKSIPDQFIIEDDEGNRAFQSYNSVIVQIYPGGKTLIDSKYWDYSKTTGKYRNQFLGETKAETQAKIDSGEYILTDLN